jgi:hypothetical protein
MKFDKYIYFYRNTVFFIKVGTKLVYLYTDKEKLIGYADNNFVDVQRSVDYYLDNLKLDKSANL